MRVCSYHWATVENELRRRGLGHLIGADSQGVARLVAEVGFEALAVALLGLTQGLVAAVGPTALLQDSCPLCVHELEDWIVPLANDVWHNARSNGLLRN